MSLGKDAGTRRGPGRPPVLEEDWAKVTVVLLNRQIAFLDHLSAEIRKRSGEAVRRSEIIRTLIDFLERSGTGTGRSSSEGDLMRQLTRLSREVPRSGSGDEGRGSE
ncbi:hypothetical protein JW921_08515 [Candidatus Fermentibacterales bacterium]|nr:hypothetical protein [Candidatus Fermentibacterales bacterium]